MQKPNHSNIDYSALSEGVRTLTEGVGAWIMAQSEVFNSSDVQTKGCQNLVSYVDQGAEDQLQAGLMELLPGSDFLGEESGRTDEFGGDLLWVVDPLDGTANFIHGLAPYCISIALLEGGSVKLGVILELTTGQLFYATEGVNGCWLQHRGVRNKITVSDVSRLEDSILLCGVAYEADHAQAADDFCRAFKHFNNRVNGLRRIGSAAANLAYVAAGRADAFFQRGLSPWDVAAGVFLVQKAGGVVSGYTPTDDYIWGRSLIATNGNINKELREEVCKNSF